MKNETWKDVPGFEGFYQASNLGNIRSLPRLIVRRNGVSETRHGRLMTASLSPTGYLHLCLVDKNSVKTFFYVHRVIALTFISSTDERPYINHINGIKTDNRVENLEWCNQKENVSHAKSMRLYDFGKKQHLAKLTDNQVECIIFSNETNIKLAKTYAVSTSTISRIKAGKIWQHIHEKLNNQQ